VSSNEGEAGMKKLLKIDPHFTACPVEIGDELYPNGIFEFNVTRLCEDIQNNSGLYTLEEMAVRDFPPSFSSINEEHLNSVGISKPLILAEIAPGRFNLIDGHHRLAKAGKDGVKSLPVYRLSVEQHIKFLTSKKSYEIYIGYWNEKIKEMK
jgi:hypothetical protein